MSTVEAPQLKPSLGRLVHYTLNESDVARIDQQRQYEPYRGNDVQVGDVFPMDIVRVWSAGPDDLTPDTAVNGQVKLDGNDTLWVTSVTLGDGPGHFTWPPRV